MVVDVDFVVVVDEDVVVVVIIVSGVVDVYAVNADEVVTGVLVVVVVDDLGIDVEVVTGFFVVVDVVIRDVSRVVLVMIVDSVDSFAIVLESSRILFEKSDFVVGWILSMFVVEIDIASVLST